MIDQKEPRQDVTGGIWVVAEHLEREIAEVTLELVSEARRLSDRLGPVSVALVGHGVSSLAPALGHYGASRAFVIDHESLASASTRFVAQIIAPLINAHRPRLVLLPSTLWGTELAAFISASLFLPLVTNCVRFSVGERAEILASKPGHGGKVFRNFVGDADTTLLVTIRPGLLDVDRPDRMRRIETIEVPFVPPDVVDVVPRVLEVVSPDPASLDVTEARVVVGAGRGIGGARNVRLLEELAELLGGTVGGTRPAVDAGWIPFSRQIGQTGKSISPRLYIACGISGAIQHMAGVQDARLIVAINNDRNAPIFRMADIGVIGDVSEVVPEMIALLKEEWAKQAASFVKEAV